MRVTRFVVLPLRRKSYFPPKGGSTNTLGAFAFIEASGEEQRLTETPEDNHNHALGALRYLMAALDEHKMARLHNTGPATQANPEATPLQPRRWLSLQNE